MFTLYYNVIVIERYYYYITIVIVNVIESYTDIIFLILLRTELDDYSKRNFNQIQCFQENVSVVDTY